MTAYSKIAASCVSALLLVCCSQPHSPSQQADSKSSFIVGVFSTVHGDCSGPAVKIDHNQISFSVDGHPPDTHQFVLSAIVNNQGWARDFGPTSTAYLVRFGERKSLAWLINTLELDGTPRVHIAFYDLKKWPGNGFLEGVDLTEPDLEFALFPCPE